MITAQVYIEHQLNTLTSFGVRADTGERVFINSKLVKKHSIGEEEIRELVLLPNADEGKYETPWRAIGVSMNDAETVAPVEPTPRVVVAKLEDRIMDHFAIEDNQYPHKASELAYVLGEEDLQMQTTLTRMHATGEIAKAQVWAKGTQEKASFVLWAPETDWFAA